MSNGGTEIDGHRLTIGHRQGVPIGRCSCGLEIRSRDKKRLRSTCRRLRIAHRQHVVDYLADLSVNCATCSGQPGHPCAGLRGRVHGSRRIRRLLAEAPSPPGESQGDPR